MEPDPAETDGDPGPETVYLRGHSRSVVTTNSSPDIGFDASINPYRGCSHGCVHDAGVFRRAARGPIDGEGQPRLRRVGRTVRGHPGEGGDALWAGSRVSCRG